MIITSFLGEFLQPFNCLGRDVSRELCGQETFLKEVLPIDCLKGFLDGCERPVRILSVRTALKFGKHIFTKPSNETISRVELDSSAANRPNPHDWMVGGGSVTYEEQHATSGHALVWIAPCMAKVPPYILQGQA